jgi:lipid II:glycine glycyltransferase (peptidoglycan interpeptide bridge formation enzyme)
MRFNFNTVKWNFRRAFGNLLPSSTLFINLKDDQDVIKKKMKPKTRYNIELAARKGVIVREAGIESMDVCYDLFRETALRNNICLYDRKYFETVLMTKADNTRSPVDVLMLIAEWEGIPLAALFLLISGKRGSYLYGASSSSHRNLMPSYAVQWEAIKICKQRGCSEYDMFGISPARHNASFVWVVQVLKQDSG